MLGKLLKNCEGIEKHQFCLWSGKVASKAKEAELAEKAKKMHTVEVAGIYIYIYQCLPAHLQAIPRCHVC